MKTPMIAIAMVATLSIASAAKPIQVNTRPVTGLPVTDKSATTHNSVYATGVQSPLRMQTTAHIGADGQLLQSCETEAVHNHAPLVDNREPK